MARERKENRHCSRADPKYGQVQSKEAFLHLVKTPSPQVQVHVLHLSLQASQSVLPSLSPRRTLDFFLGQPLPARVSAPSCPLASLIFRRRATTLRCVVVRMCWRVAGRGGRIDGLTMVNQMMIGVEAGVLCGRVRFMMMGKRARHKHMNLKTRTARV